MKPRILLDMDGVIANFYKGFAEYLNEEYHCTLDPLIEPVGYDIDTWGSGIEKINIDEASVNWIKQGGYAKISSFYGASDFVKQLSRLCNIFIVTARIGDWDSKFKQNIKDKIKQDTINWLDKNDMPSNKLYFVHEKISFCVENGISIMVEDKLETALMAAKNGIHAVLMDREYNQSPADRLRIYRVYNLNDAFKQVKRLSK